MSELMFLAVVVLTFLLAGAIKGITGLGLPTVVLAVLTVVSDMTTAMALLLIPSFCTNLWQALHGGQLSYLLTRTWMFLLPATLLVPIGGQALVMFSPDDLVAVLGVVLMLYALVGLYGVQLSLKPSEQGWTGVLAGTVNGILTGMTGSFVVPGVIYLQAMGLTRNQLIQAMGILFTLSTLALAGNLGRHGLLSSSDLIFSALGLIPALLGMKIGQIIRFRLSDRMFRKLFYAALLALGSYILLTAIG